MLGNRFGQAFVGPAVIQRAELTDGHIQVGFTLSVLIGFAMAVMIWLFAPFIGDFFREPTASQVLQALSVIFVINGIGSVPTHSAAPRPAFQGIDGGRHSGLLRRLRLYGNRPGPPGLRCMVSCLGRDHAQGGPYGDGNPLHTHAPASPLGAPGGNGSPVPRGRIFAGPIIRVHRPAGRLLCRRALAGSRIAWLFHARRQADPVAEKLRRPELVPRAFSGHGAAATRDGTPGNHLPAWFRSIIPGGFAGKRHAFCVRSRDCLGNPGGTVGPGSCPSADPGVCRPVPDVRYPEFRRHRRAGSGLSPGMAARDYTPFLLSAAPGMRAAGAWRPW